MNSDPCVVNTSIYVPGDAEAALLLQITFPLNHCNVPASLLASVAYQTCPIPLEIDGIRIWYSGLFNALQDECDPDIRALRFNDFMTARFHLAKVQAPELRESDPPPRPKVNYRRLLLGWLFDSDNEQGAAWRSWVESRFGLVTCFHHEFVSGPDSPEYLRFRGKCTRATYNTNELYSQLDLLYSFCQQELRLRYPEVTHLTLYRGCSELPEYILDGQSVRLFNNLSSFTADPESALRFGSQIFAVQVPLTKIACFESLLPHSLQGEQEFMVLGGLYQVEKVRLLGI
ncbi:NAD(+)--dinitrogen-reductase ADP-D-ribosyltransferase [Vibrio sp. HA2012]|uniref:NAD(+)--dinitrogen-reductase ADP-D-ribosyltransferase n=1 Tax=Vibrio sp. HA2012 TaxID=1971595 RepID=UPI0012FE29BD|nr:NAD(+)--dinitrogen-reductase ADP-D-ribosyltransferase [Vibrio sp. HA2012]